MIITIVITLATGLTYHDAVRPLRNYKFWISIMLLVVIVPIFAGVQDNVFLGISYSSQKLDQTFLMILRGISVFMFIQVLTTNLDSRKIEKIMLKLRIKHFSELLDLSRSIIPKAEGIARTMRGKLKSNLKNGVNIRKFYYIIVDVFVDLIRLTNKFDASDLPTLSSDPETLIQLVSHQKKPSLLIVAGEPWSGKSHWFKSLNASLQSKKINSAGVITAKANINEPEYNQILIDISTNEKRQLSTTNPFSTNIRTDRFYFYEETFSWGNEIIKHGIASEWLIIDEVGILEQKGTGFGPAIKNIPESFKGVLLFALRTSLIAELDQILNEHYPIIGKWQRHLILIDK
ncbi:nucleoside-triphosphatase [Candidatus Neomarinimicrobiota bacterium]